MTNTQLELSSHLMQFLPRETFSAAWPAYEALDEHGFPYWRPARYVHELPQAMQAEALARIHRMIEWQVGLKLVCSPRHELPIDRLVYGVKLYQHFDLNAGQINCHRHRDLLVQRCCDLPLWLIHPFEYLPET